MVMTYNAFSATMIGSSHIKHGKECQDSSSHYPPYGKNWPLALAVVADGHGSEDNFRSARGAAIAARCAAQGIIDFYKAHKSEITSAAVEPTLSNRDEFDKMLRELAKHIVARWQISVEKDYTQNPFTPKELEQVGEKHRKEYEAGECLYKAYGTTLIATAITADYWFGIHIGDGRFTALYKDGSFDQPVPWDKRCFLNMTTSICDDDAATRARLYFSFHAEKEPPCAVFLCSDGVDDNYPVDNNEKHLFKLYRTIALTFVEDGFDSTCGQIKDLANSFATKGKGDDTSIAGFIDMEAATQAAEVWRKQIAEEEAPPTKVEDAKAATENAEPVPDVPEELPPKQTSAANTVTQNAPEQESDKPKEAETQKGIAAYEQQIKPLEHKPEEYGEYERPDK
jgi:serine/threonine protein phosphatase PrpC